MPTVPFTKEEQTYEQLLQKLKDIGLKISSDTKALHLLEKLSYYRLSGYWYPLLDEPKEAHVFKSGATLQTAFELYRFDRDLRIFILKELEKIEVAVRSQMIYHMSHGRHPFWLSDPSIFKDINSHRETLKKLQKDYFRSDEEYIKAFKEKYSDPLPPCWMTLEITSFGSLSIIYGNIKSIRPKRDIAQSFGLDETTFASWLHSFVYIRNVCAHHSRLWNRGMSIRPKRPVTPNLQWITDDTIPNNKTYYILCMLLYLLQSIDARHQFIFRIKVLLSKYPTVDVAAMGFPNNWEDEALWKFRPTIKQWLRLNIFSKFR